MEIASQLYNMGLSKYEAQTLESLLKIPNQTAEQISDNAEVPKGRIYDVLNKLAERNMVRFDRDRPRTYNAVEAEIALERLVEEKRREKEKELQEFETRASEVREELETIEPNEVQNDFWTTAVKEDEARELLLERLAASEEEVLIFKGSPGIDPGTWKKATDTLRSLIDDGVRIRLLLNDTERIDKEHLKEGLPVSNENLEIRQAVVSSRSHFYVIDQKETSLEIAHPGQTQTMLAVLNMRNSEIVDDLKESFHSIWEDARPYFDDS